MVRRTVCPSLAIADPLLLLAYVGTVPAQEIDSLQTVALQMFPQGLKAACDPTPTLAAAQPPATVAPTKTVSVPGGSAPGPTTTPAPAPPADDPPVTSTTPSAPEPSDPPTETCNTLAQPTLHAPRRRRVLSLGRFHIEFDE